MRQVWCKDDTPSPSCRVEAGHEFTICCACGGEVLVTFIDLDAEAGDLLLEGDDLVVEGVDVCWRAESGFAPGLLAEGAGQALFELADVRGEPGGALVCCEQVSLQGRPGDGRAGGRGGRRGRGLERVDSAEEVGMPVEEGAVDALLTELELEFQQFNG